MEKSTVTLSALSVAVVSSGIAAWALLKWHQTTKRLKRFTEKYEDPKEVQRLLMEHFCSLEPSGDLSLLSGVISKESLGYHSNLAQYVTSTCEKYKVSKNRILDVGCGPGVTSFHLSRNFKQVIGTDMSMPMIMAGQQLKQFAEFGSPFSLEGGKYISLIKMRVPEGTQRDNVTFWNEDACALSYAAGHFDCVLASRVITDLYDPKAFLEDIGQYVKEGGLLIISDVYHWENGPEEKLGGEGDVSTFSLLKEILCKSWTFLQQDDINCYFVKSSRLAEVGVSHITVWRKKADIDI